MADYATTGYVASGYYQTGISVDWEALVIHVPKMFLTPISGSAYTLDTNLLRQALQDVEDSPIGMLYPPTHRHNTTVTLAGVQYARIIEMINGYTITFEDGQYSVNLIGSNNNIGDSTNINQVSVRVNNSAGLQNVSTPTNVVTGTALTESETANAVWMAASRTLTASLDATAEQIAAQVRNELATELALLAKVSKIHGVGVTLVVTPTSRTAGDLSQTITTVGNTTTVSAA
jgi:hypothetical protein